MENEFSSPVEQFDLSKPWYFIYAVKEPSDEKRRDKDADICTFYRMRLDPDGTMAFDTFTNLQTSMFTVEGRIQDIYRMRSGDGFLAQDEQVEGVMYCDEDNLHTIVRTNWWALPNLQNIEDALRFSDDGRTLTAEYVLDMLSSFGREQKGKYKDEISVAENGIRTLGKQFTLKDLRDLKNQEAKIFSGRKKWVKEFSEFWFRESSKGEHPVLLVPCFTAAKNTPLDYGLTDVSDIQAFTHSVPELYNHQATGEEAYVRGYLSGIRMSGWKYGCDKGVVIRDIIPEEGMPDQSDEILPLLDVDFVMSNDMFSVLPFPFKYLREYAKMAKEKRTIDGRAC